MNTVGRKNKGRGFICGQVKMKCGHGHLRHP
jgi:hypothetical protein